MTFQIGETVVHPHYGAGVITEIQERHSLGPRKRYYSIELLGDSQTTVMVPLDREESVGLRQPISKARLSRLWRILRGEPHVLPDAHKERYEVIEDKFAKGDIFQIADTLHISRERVRQIEARALRRLRYATARHELKKIRAQI